MHEAENLHSEPAQVKQKAVFDLEKERAEYERQMQRQAPVYSEAPQTNPTTHRLLHDGQTQLRYRLL